MNISLAIRAEMALLHCIGLCAMAVVMVYAFKVNICEKCRALARRQPQTTRSAQK